MITGHYTTTTADWWPQIEFYQAVPSLQSDVRDQLRGTLQEVEKHSDSVRWQQDRTLIKSANANDQSIYYDTEY